MKSLPRLIGGLIASLCLSSLLLSAAGADAPPSAKLPSAKEVIARYVQAMGGREAILKTSALRAKGKYEIASMGVSGQVEMVRARPNKQLVRISIDGFGQTSVGFDGTVGWMIDPMTGPKLIDGKMLEQTREDAEFYGQLHDETNYRKMEVVGKGAFEGQDCYEMKLVWKSGREGTEYFDLKSGLIAGTKLTQETAQGQIHVVNRFSDYRKFGEIMQPTRMAQKMGDLEQVLTMTSFSYDAVPEAEFEQPEAIKALTKAQPAK